MYFHLYDVLIPQHACAAHCRIRFLAGVWRVAEPCRVFPCIYVMAEGHSGSKCGNLLKNDHQRCSTRIIVLKTRKNF